MTDPQPPHEEILDDAVLRDRDALGDQLTNLWWTFLLRGILAGLLGIAALFWPTSSISLLLRLVGLLLILDGGLTLLGFGRRGLIGGVGIGALLIGLVLLVWPEGVAKLTFFLLGAWALIVGIGSIMAWRQMPDRNPDAPTVRNSGILALIIGLALIFWPGTGMVALGWAIAFSALAFAVVMFWLTARFKRAHDRVAMKVVNR
ncbi:HdeD family acid-resistance protein [Ruegeria meonggei]|uniref:HdeD family acid-resistance protein n=1 Tax=Ruegeria meonggei TaxID=1446476 RepID=UPI00366B525F